VAGVRHVAAAVALGFGLMIGRRIGTRRGGQLQLGLDAYMGSDICVMRVAVRRRPGHLQGQHQRKQQDPNATHGAECYQEHDAAEFCASSVTTVRHASWISARTSGLRGMGLNVLTKIISALAESAPVASTYHVPPGAFSNDDRATRQLRPSRRVQARTSQR
jgi:hypothetical protein